jgi:hydrogenase-4 component E
VGDAVTVWVDSALVLIILTNLVLLGSSRIRTAIRTAALQGIILALLPLVCRSGGPVLHSLLLAAGSMALKGVLFPWLLFRARREANVRREPNPFVGYNASVMAGVVAMGLSLWLGARLPLPSSGVPPLVLPAAFFTILSGLFLMVTRKTALTQVVGYLVLENGIYTFGVAVVQDSPWLVELGVLLDVFVAVFVMGITVFHISREFEHVDTERLAALKDWTP